MVPRREKSADSQYRDYYIFSDNPQADIRHAKIPMIATEGARGYDSGQWFSAVTGVDGKLKVRFTLALDNAGKPSTLRTGQGSRGVTNTGSQNSGIWLYYGDDNMERG